MNQFLLRDACGRSPAEAGAADVSVEMKAANRNERRGKLAK
jgi:hypothetical protein